VVFYYHNVTPPELWTSSVAREELQRGVEGVSLVHFADLAVADSPFNRDDLLQRGYDPERIYVLPLAVPIQAFAPGPKNLQLVHRYGLEGRRVLLFVGRMASNKRIDLLVEALSLVKKQVPDVVLLLIGDGDSSQPYQDVVAHARRRAAELGVERDVVFTGVVDHLPAHYRLADLYVTASLHEGFGVPLIEAMASGVPVVASRVASHPWVVDQAGLLCEPEDAADTADKLVVLLKDDKRYGALVQRGLERARTFSLEAYDAGFAEIVDAATRWVRALPPLERPGIEEEAALESYKPLGIRRGGMLVNDMVELSAQADVMMRPYVVRSSFPVLGPLIAWVRRNLTSHLREPYLDPTLERQVKFNQLVVDGLERLQDLSLEQLALQRRDVGTFGKRLARVEKRLDLLEAQVKALNMRHDKGDLDVLKQLEAEIAELAAALDRDGSEWRKGSD
jgi:hypothetical protein